MKLTKAQHPDTCQQKGLQRRLRELDKQIDTGAGRVLTAPDNLVEVLTTKLQQMKRDREQIEQQLKRIQKPPAINIEKQIKQLADKVWSLMDELQKAEPARVRELLQRAIDRVELSFTARQQGKRRTYHATGGKVVFRGLSGFASRGDWI